MSSRIVMPSVYSNFAIGLYDDLIATADGYNAGLIYFFLHLEVDVPGFCNYLPRMVIGVPWKMGLKASDPDNTEFLISPAEWALELLRDQDRRSLLEEEVCDFQSPLDGRWFIKRILFAPGGKTAFEGTRESKDAPLKIVPVS